MSEIIKHKFPYLLFFLLLFSTFASGQERLITLSQTNAALSTVLEEIEKQTSMSIVYNTRDINPNQVVSIKVAKQSLDNAMNQLFKGTDVTYAIVDKHIILSLRKEKDNQQKKTPISAVGTVLDTNGEAMIGVNIIIKGTKKGTITDFDGDFKLEASQGDILEISYIGYMPQSITLTNAQPLHIKMSENTKELDVVVVTALGIKRSEKALSYNVQEITSDEFNIVKDANFMNSLVGKVAGAQINSSAGGAGGSARVVMRGVKSISSPNLALYVIDGIPMYNMMSGADDQGSIFSNQPGTDGVADLNPDDIESITMLTGPSAAALYGNAGAAGVVLINTKKGSAEKTTITVTNNTTFSNVQMMPKMQSKYGNLPNELESWGNVVNNSYDPKDFFKTGSNVMNTISLSTGNKKNQSYLSASTTNATNILPNSGYDRYNFTARNTTNFLNDKMTLDVGLSYILQNDKNMMAQGYYYNPLPGLYAFPRSENFDDVRMFERENDILDFKEQFWPYGGITSGLQNPYWVQNREIRRNKKSRYMMNASLKYEITDWLDVSGRVKVDSYNNRYINNIYASTDNLFSGKNGNYRDMKSDSKTTYGDLIATINKTHQDWSFNVNLGTSINDNRFETLGIDGGLNLPNYFAVHNIDYNDGFKTMQKGWHDQSQAIFVSAEVGWRSMLYLTATGRNDWESRLAFSDYGSFFYPSVGLSAILTSMFDAPKWLSYMKVRGSYTEVGNSYDRFMTTLSLPYDEQNKEWHTRATYPNTDLKPERTKSWEIGLDARLFNDLSFNLTYYRSNTFNQTFYAELPPSAGYSTIPIQSGNIMNQGIELTLGYDKKWNDFTLSTNYTLTWNENKVIRLADGAHNYLTGEPVEMDELPIATYGNMDARLILRPGGSMGDVYGQRVLKRDLNGYINYVPGKGVELETKETFLGSIFPKANMGWSTQLGYKGINLGVTFTARIGGIAISETESNLDSFGVSKRTADARDNGGVLINQGIAPAKQYYQTISGTAAYYTYSATNVRLGELSLSYTLPKKWLNNKYGASVGLVGKNLWMIYCKAPFDPELTSAAASNHYQGFDAYMLPSTRNIGFNVKLQF